MEIPTDPIEYAKWKEAGGGKSDDTAKAEADAKAAEAEKAEKEAQAAKDAEAIKAADERDAKAAEEKRLADEEAAKKEVADDKDDIDSTVVPLSKYMSEKNARKERDKMIDELAKENERLKGLVPKSERDKLIQDKVKAYAEKTGASEEAAREFLGIIQEALGADREAIDTFNRERAADAKAKADGEAAKERERKLGKEFESKEFKTFLDEKGITKPEDISTLKKNLVSDALSLPDGVPLKRVYLSGDYSGKFEPKEPTEKKVGEGSQGGNLDKPKDKPVREMTSEEYRKHKESKQTSQTFRIMGADGKVRHYTP